MKNFQGLQNSMQRNSEECMLPKIHVHFYCSMINLTSSKHDAYKDIILEIQSESFILSNLFLNSLNLNFHYINLVLHVSKAS